MTRYSMTIPEASHLVLQAAAIGAGGEMSLLAPAAPRPSTRRAVAHRSRPLASVITVLAVLVCSACGPRVKEISLHDQSIPVDSRRFLADTQDAVSIARVARDEAAREVARTRDWRREVVRGVSWPANAANAIQKLNVLADNRVELAEMELDKANLALQLATAKYDLVRAETAIRHDIARYDLEPLRARHDDARDRMRATTEGIIRKRDEIDKLTTTWWEAYSGWASKGDTRLYYIPFIDDSASTAPAKSKKGDAKKKKVAKKAEPESKTATKTKAKTAPTAKESEKTEEQPKDEAPKEKSDELRIW